MSDRIELGATVLMAIAAVLTAWAAFEATKWSGVQANSYSAANTARTESARATTVASGLRDIDVATFLQWLEAYRDDTEAGRIPPAAGDYQPDSATLSGFIAGRFRDEFEPAFEAWAAQRPLLNPGAAATPFQLPAYVLSAEAEADALAAAADEHARIARQANQRGDNYVLLSVLFAVGLFFAGVSGKLDTVTTSAATLGASAIIVAVSAIIMATFPREF